MSQQQFLQTSLEALLSNKQQTVLLDDYTLTFELFPVKATNVSSFCLDYASLEAFATLVNREREGPYTATRVIAARLPSENEREVLLSLNVLESCMVKCGGAFRAEVGKFRFLNEVIKLVSPKYLGAKTTPAVKNKILQLLYLWTVDYPKEIKIKEAFDMLRKQGVVKDMANLNAYQEIGMAEKKKVAIPVGSVFHDEEKSNILRKLLQSKDPEDIQAANWLIKSMVKEDEKVTQLKSKYACELQGIQNNIKLLNEMLDSYVNSDSTASELDLMKELYDNCVRFKPNLEKLEWQVEQLLKPEILDNVVRTTEELNEAINKYETILNKKRNDCNAGACALLELNLSGTASLPTENDNLIKPAVDYLSDIFCNTTVSENCDILQPVTVENSFLNKDHIKSNSTNKNDKTRGLKELDELGEHLLKENLQTANLKKQEKIPMNLIEKNTVKEATNSAEINLDLDLRYLIENKSKSQDVPKCVNSKESTTPDDCLVDIEEKINSEEKPLDIKLNDLHLKLEEIKPSCAKPLIINDKNGILVTLYLTKDKPKEGVVVYVMTTINKNEMALSDYLFQAVVPTGLKVKIQQPPSDNLPPFNPFLPPSAITHIIFLANPKNEEASLKFMISYSMDGETITEMGEVEKLPFDNS